MTKLWTHPNYAGGCARRSTVGAGSNDKFYSGASGSAPSVVRGVPNEFLTTFLLAGIFSACLTMGLLAYHYANRDPRIAFGRHPSMHPDSFVDGSSRLGSAKESFLAGMLSQQAFDLKKQIRFVSNVIRSQVRNHPETDELAFLIVSESFKAQVDPLYVAAVIRSESMFKGGAVSTVGARGLMQIMPKTGLFLSKRENIKIDGRRGLHDPHTNLKLGIAYLKYLEQKFGGNRTRALIAYNWGPANLNEAIKSRQAAPSSTVRYAQKILSTHRQWRQEYQQQFALGAAHTFG